MDGESVCRCPGADGAPGAATNTLPEPTDTTPAPTCDTRQVHPNGAIPPRRAHDARGRACAPSPGAGHPPPARPNPTARRDPEGPRHRSGSRPRTPHAHPTAPSTPTKSYEFRCFFKSSHRCCARRGSTRTIARPRGDCYLNAALVQS